MALVLPDALVPMIVVMFSTAISAFTNPLKLVKKNFLITIGSFLFLKETSQVPSRLTLIFIQQVSFIISFFTYLYNMKSEYIKKEWENGVTVQIPPEPLLLAVCVAAGWHLKTFK